MTFVLDCTPFRTDATLVYLGGLFLHHAEVMVINGPSYRMCERQITLSPPSRHASGSPGSSLTGVG